MTAIKIVLFIACSLGFLFDGACGQRNARDTTSTRNKLKTEDDKTLYAFGLLLGRNAAPFNLNSHELELVQLGIRDTVLGTQPLVDAQKYGPKVGPMAFKRSQQRNKQETKRSNAFLKEAAQEKGVTQLPSGLIYREIKSGHGVSPSSGDRVKIHYHGTLSDGKPFESSRDGQPVEFLLGTIRSFGALGSLGCIVEGLQRMRVGGKAKLICPPQLAYGDQGRPPKIPGGAALIFEIELFEVNKVPPSTSAPHHSTAPTKRVFRPGHRTPM